MLQSTDPPGQDMNLFIFIQNFLLRKSQHIEEMWSKPPSTPPPQKKKNSHKKDHWSLEKEKAKVICRVGEKGKAKEKACLDVFIRSVRVTRRSAEFGGSGEQRTFSLL